MKKKMLYSIALTGLLGIMSARAQNNQPADQLKMLKQLKGNWKTEAATMQANGTISRFAYTANFTVTADGHGLLMTESADIPGAGKLSATNLIGVSPYDGKVHWFSVDNIDVAHEHIGQFADKRHFSMEYKEMQNGKEYAETVKIELPDSDTLILKIQINSDGKEIALITGNFHRKKTK